MTFKFPKIDIVPNICCSLLFTFFISSLPIMETSYRNSTLTLIYFCCNLAKASPFRDESSFVLMFMCNPLCNVFPLTWYAAIPVGVFLPVVCLAFDKSVADLFDALFQSMSICGNLMSKY